MKASSSITISHVTDGLTTYYEYAKNSSNTTAPSSGATWSATVPTSEAGKFIWRREGYALPGENPTTWGNVVCLTGATGTKGDPGTAGTSGLNSAVVFLYKRGATAPTKPSTNATYTFATGILTGHNNSWTQAIPATNGQPLWVIQATASATAPTATATILSTAWGTQIKLVEDGTKGDPGSAGVNGLNQATIYLYQRKASVPGVTDIADPITYKFSDGTITGSLGSWSKSVPGGNNPLYVTIAVAIGNGATDTIPRSEWTTPTLMAKDGAKGDPGTPGKGVVSVVTEYALSDSSTELEEIELSPDLVAYLPFNGTAKDYVSGQVASAVDVSVTDGPGVKKAYIFNGSTSRIAVPDIGSSPKGFSVMVYVDAIPTGNEIVLVHGTSKIGLGFYSNGSLITGACGGTNPKVAIISNFNVGEWNNIIVNYVSGGAEVFINGTGLSYSSATNCWTAGGNDLTVGFRDTSSPGSFKGALADLRVYNRNVTPADYDDILEDLQKVSTVWYTTPPERGEGQFIWTRQVITYTDETVTITEPICVTGDKGPPGNPGALGVNVDGDTLEVAGYDNEGEFGASTGRVYLGSSFYTLEQTLYTVTENGNGYILGSASGLVSFAKIEPLTDSGASRVAWMEFNTGEEIVGDVVIGEFKVENGVIVEANIVPTMTLDQFITSNFIKLLRTAPNENSTRLLAMAMGVDTVFQSIVAMEAFIRELWVYKMQSEAYSEDAQGNPLSGFKFDGETGEGKITNLKARGADISGDFLSSGFKTLGVVPGITRPTYTVPSTIYKHSEMTDLVTESSELQSVPGTIDGITFTKATRRNGARILLGEKGYFEKTVNAGKTEIISYLLPPTTFGVNFYIQWHIHYSGNLSLRRLAERKYLGANEFSSSLMTKREVSSGEHSGTFNLQTGIFNAFTVEGKSNALWGSVLAYSNYLKVWTSQDFTGVVLTGGTSAPYKTIPFEPNAYYLSASKPFTIGATNQDTGSIKKYKSGTDLYNHFSNVPSGKDIACTGKINVNGTVHTVTRLRREANRMVFYAGQEVLVQKFIEGTSQGVYTELAVTQQFVIGATEGGIETMSILPWANATYDIGEVARKFRSLYLSGEVNANSGVFAGALSANTVNTGQGANSLYAMNQNMRTSDSPSFVKITAGLAPKYIELNDNDSQYLRILNAKAGSALIYAYSGSVLQGTTSSYVKVLEVVSIASGTLTITFNLKQYTSGDYYVYGRIYKNGSAFGTVRKVISTTFSTFSQNLSFVAGDKIQLYLKSDLSNKIAQCEIFQISSAYGLSIFGMHF